MLLDIVKNPFRSGYISRMGISYVLQVFSFLLVPVFILIGYFMLLSRSAAIESPEPQFSNPIGLAIIGVKAVCVILAYFLLPFAFFVSAIIFVYYTGFDTFSQAQQAPLDMLGLYPLIALASGTILTGVSLYILPGALVEVAVSNDMPRAFYSSKLQSHLVTWEYVAAVLGLLVLCGIWLGGVALAFHTVVGMLLLPVLTIYILDVVAYLFGTTYRISTQRSNTRILDTDPPDDLKRYE